MIPRAAIALVLTLAVAGCGGATGHPGRRLFVSSRCGECHTLADAGTRGGVGPDFDTSERLDRRQLMTALVAGVNGMPSYRRALSRRQRALLADYLLAVAWKRGGQTGG